MEGIIVLSKKEQDNDKSGRAEHFFNISHHLSGAHPKYADLCVSLSTRRVSML